MGYSNSYTLDIKGEASNIQKMTVCLTCQSRYPVDTGFCSNDGHKLVVREVATPIEKDEIIARLRKASEEASFLLEDDGTTRENGSGYDIAEDILKFSTKYPKIIFELNATWDQGFDEPPSRYYIKNGKKQDCVTTVTYEKYDESKLV